MVFFHDPEFLERYFQSEIESTGCRDTKVVETEGAASSNTCATSGYFRIDAGIIGNDHQVAAGNGDQLPC